MSEKPTGWEVVLIVPPAVRDLERKADQTGEYHAGKGLFGYSVAKAGGRRIQDSLTEIVAQVGTMIETIRSGPVGDLELEGLEVGLALSAEGTVGFATGGIEANITLKFKAKPGSST